MPMNKPIWGQWISLVVQWVWASLTLQAFPFEGRVEIVLSRKGAENSTILYTVGAGNMRIESVDSKAQKPINIIDLKTGTTTLLFPRNHTFVHFPLPGSRPSMPAIDSRPMPLSSLPPGIGPQSGVLDPRANEQGAATTAPPIPSLGASPPAGIGPNGSVNGLTAYPVIPRSTAAPSFQSGFGPQFSPSFGTTSPGVGAASAALPAMPLAGEMEKVELAPTHISSNILGYHCVQYELKQQGETAEIWATSELFPWDPYLLGQPRSSGPQSIDEQWSKLLKAKGLFPLHVLVRFSDGSERSRLEVTSIKLQKLSLDDFKAFELPAGYAEDQPLPF